MKYVIWFLVAGLLIAHQDSWNWDNGRLVFGFLPIGLFYHAAISLAAGVVWFLACTIAWPEDIDEDDYLNDADASIASTVEGK